MDPKNDERQKQQTPGASCPPGRPDMNRGAINEEKRTTSGSFASESRGESTQRASSTAGASAGTTPSSPSQGAGYSATGSREPFHARETADEMKRRAGSLRNRARDTASNMRSQAKDQFSAAGHRLRDASRSGVERQKGWAATEVRHVSDAMREAASKLHQENDEGLAKFADSAARQTSRISEYLDDADVDQLVDDVGDFARRRPEIFYGTMFIAGLALARFLKASRPDYEPTYRSSADWRGRDEMDYDTYAYDNDEERFHAAAGTSAAPSSVGARTSSAQTGAMGSGSSAAGHTPPAP